MNPLQTILNKAKGIVGGGKETVLPTSTGIAPTSGVGFKTPEIKPTAQTLQTQQTFGLPGLSLAPKEQTKLDAIKQYVPQSLLNIGTQLKQGVVGSGQGVDIAGRPTYDTGFLGFFRPLGVGKPVEQKVIERSDALKPLVDQGLITPERAELISKEPLIPTGAKAVAKGLPFEAPKLTLTPQEEEALKPIKLEETIDTIAGALDIISVGTMKPVTKGAAELIARSKVPGQIADILQKEIPLLTKDSANKIATSLVNIDRAEDVASVITRAEQKALKLSGIDDTANQIFKTETQPPNTVFEKITKAEIDNWNPKDISGLGDGASLNMRDTAFSIDNLRIDDVAKRGEWGPATKVYYNFHKAEAGKITFVNRIEHQIGDVLKKISKTDLQQLAEYRLGNKSIQLTDKLADANKKITEVTDQIRNEYNAWAKANNQPEIGRVDDYLTKRAKYEDVFIGDRTGFSENFTIPRVGGKIPGEQEKDIGKLLGSYVNTVANKMYMQSAFSQLDSLKAQLMNKGINKGAKFIDNFTKDMMKIESQDALSKIGRSLISARATYALAFNPVWSITVQPGSFALTAARNPGLNILTGSLKYAKMTPADRAWLESLPNYRIKTTQSLSATGVGDIGSDTLRPTIGSKREWLNKKLGFLGDNVERILSGNAAFIARDYGAKKGLKGSALDMYADLMIGATQSEYIKSARAAALRPLLTRFLVPFQTYAFETYRFGKTLAGQSGGLPLKVEDRIIQGATFLSAVFAWDWLQSKVSGRKITSIGTFVPLVGAVADYTLAKLTGKDGFRSGRSPVAPIGEAETAAKALKQAFENNNYEPLRKEMIKWGFGFTGIGGASQVNRLIDGWLAVARGYHVTSGGNEAFKVETPLDKVIAPVLGPSATMAGREYKEGGFQSTYIKTKEELSQEVQQKRDSGEFGSNAVANEYYKAEIKKIESAQKKERMKLPEEEYKAVLNSLLESGEFTTKDLNKEWEEYQKQPVEKPRGKVKTALAFAQAFTIDPGNAWKALWTAEKLGDVEGNLVQLKRFYGIDFDKPGGSEEYKKKVMYEMGIPWKQSKNYKLEHIIPVGSGGDNSPINLVVVDNATHNSYKELDKATGRAVRAGRMTRKQITEIMIAVKVDKTMTIEQAMAKLK